MNVVLNNTDFSHWTGRLVRRLRRRYNEQCINILTYHDVGKEDDIFTAKTNLRRSPTEFEKDIAYLADHYSIISLGQLVDALARGEQTKSAVVITFDDGYAGVLRYAYPILYRRRIPMTVFPVTSVIDNQDLLWQHKLAWLLSNGHEQRLRDAIQAAGGRTPKNDGGISEFVRRHYRADLHCILDEVLASVGASGTVLAEQHKPYITAKQIADCDAELVEFGNHTDTHPVLSALTETEQRVEIETAKKKLRDFTGKAPDAIAYPFGLKPHYNETTERIARDTGCRAALDMRRRMNVGRVDPYQLSRKPIPQGSRTQFEMMIEDWPANARFAPPGGKQ